MNVTSAHQYHSSLRYAGSPSCVLSIIKWSDKNNNEDKVCAVSALYYRRGFIGRRKHIYRQNAPQQHRLFSACCCVNNTNKTHELCHKSEWAVSACARRGSPYRLLNNLSYTRQYSCFWSSILVSVRTAFDLRPIKSNMSTYVPILIGQGSNFIYCCNYCQ